MNDEQLATDIKRAFGRYHAEPRPIESLAADSLGVGVAPAVDSRPPLLARRRLLGGLSLAGVAAAVAMAFALTLGIGPGPTSPQSVWAGWQPIPTTPDEGLRNAAPEACANRLNIAGGDAVPGSSFSYSDLKLIAQDQRGPGAVFVFAREATMFACMVWPNQFGGYDAVGFSMASEMHALPCHLEPMAEGGDITAVGTFSPTNPQLVTIYGRTDASKVLMRRPNGVQVQATVKDGFFVAWWPGGGAPSDLVAYDERGGVLQTLASFNDPAVGVCRANPTATNALS